MNEAERRASTAKGGPRVFTAVPDLNIQTGIIADTINNCPKCPLPTGVTVWNEDGVVGQRDLLVHGWYVLDTDIPIFWQQVSPKDACSTNPVATGKKLNAGGCIPFFVDESVIDGVIVISFCPGALSSIEFSCGVTLFTPTLQNVAGLVRISRSDTILKMSDTGDSATKMAGTPSLACGPGLPVPTP